MNLETEEIAGNSAGNQLSVNSQPYQTQECILYGTIPKKLIPVLEGRLAGLCDPGFQEFREHEMSFAQTRTRTEVKIRRRFRTEPSYPKLWVMKYIGVSEDLPQVPVIVRKETTSMIQSEDMMEFMKSIGCFMNYEFMAEGRVYTKARTKVMISKLTKSSTPGLYNEKTLTEVSSLALVEMSISLPESADFNAAAKELRSFADQLLPIVEMVKVELPRRIFQQRA